MCNNLQRKQALVLQSEPNYQNNHSELLTVWSRTSCQGADLSGLMLPSSKMLTIFTGSGGVTAVRNPESGTQHLYEQVLLLRLTV